MKTHKLSIILILMTIFLIFNINSVLATEIEETDLDYEQEELTTEEYNATLLTEDDVEEELPSTELLNTNGSANVSTINSISEMNLKLNNILNIILIAIGILLILFAIAILIRLKN